MMDLSLGSTKSCRPVLKTYFHRYGLPFAVCVYLAHLIALPVGITYDGHIYIDLADVLWSKRFPQDWFFARTPLYPCALKLSFWLFGKQPLSVVLVSSIVGLIGIFAVASTIKREAGPVTGLITLVSLSLFPTLVAYEHFALTEAGTFCFLALILWLLMLRPRTERHQWWTTVALVLVISCGYYWRQNVIFMAPFAALVYGISVWKFRATTVPPPQAHAILRTAAQVALIAILPFVLSWPWSHLSNNTSLRDVMLEYGVLKEALLPPEDPFVGANAEAYRAAIQTSMYKGHLYSGLRSDLHSSLSVRVFSQKLNESAPSFFFSLVRKYPRRYVAGVMRTLVLFAGLRGLENENYIFRDQILSPTFVGSKISEGPPALDRVDRENFLERTTDSVVLQLFWTASRLYDSLLILAWGLTIGGLFTSLLLRNLPLFVLCATPVYYVLPYALTLSAVDRYAFPVYPIVLAVLLDMMAISVFALKARLNHREVTSTRQKGDSIPTASRNTFSSRS
jgi:4-amino-4-deoxy-L-arabinose transferase-like glycosyltransferase